MLGLADPETDFDIDRELFWWGVYLRAIGLVYAISLASLFQQIAGLDKIYPTEVLLKRVKKDNPSWFVFCFLLSGFLRS